MLHNRKHAPRGTTTELVAMRDEEAPIDTDGNVETIHPVAEDDKLLPQPPQGPTAGKKVGAALFYATSSLGVIFANKIVLSTYRFPSVQTLALAQFTATTLALMLASLLGYVDLLPISVQHLADLSPPTRHQQRQPPPRALGQRAAPGLSPTPLAHPGCGTVAVK